MHDIVIIGAGAIGLHTAKLLGDFDVVVIEKNRQIGGHTCSGLYSTNLSGFFPIKKEWVEHTVKGAVLHSPGGAELVLEKPDMASYVIDRDRMEQSLYGDVQDRVSLNTTANRVVVSTAKAAVKTQTHTLEAKLLIGCDGAYSTIARHFGSRPAEILNGLIALTNEPNNADHVELWFDKEKLPDGFFWKIPRGDRTEYGMLGANVQFPQLEKFFSLPEQYQKRFGFIPIGPAEKTYFPRTLLMGNAAGLLKPWSGGGILYGLTCAGIIREVAEKAFTTTDFSEAILQEYELRWKEKIGRSITMGLMFRSFYRDTDNGTIDRLFRTMNESDVWNTLDMDFPLADIMG